MRRALAFALLLACCASVALAQTLTVPADVPLTVAAEHDGEHTQGYRLYVDGLEVTARKREELVDGRIEFSVPGLPHGAHSLELAAFNVDHETRSAPVAVTAQYEAPNAPHTVTVTITITVNPGQP